MNFFKPYLAFGTIKSCAVGHDARNCNGVENLFLVAVILED